MNEPAAGALRRTIPLTLFLVLGFGGLTTLAVAVQVLFSVEASRVNTLELLRDKAAIAVDGIEARAHAFLRPVAAQGQAITRLLLKGAMLSDPRTGPFLGDWFANGLRFSAAEVATALGNDRLGADALIAAVREPFE